MCGLWMDDDGRKELKTLLYHFVFIFLKRIMLKIVTLSQMMVHYFAVVINFSSEYVYKGIRVNFVSFEMVLSLKLFVCCIVFIFL